jgi:hypothetical protein
MALKKTLTVITMALEKYRHCRFLYAGKTGPGESYSIDLEDQAWALLIQRMIGLCGDRVQIYLKGGSVLGLYVLDQTIEHCGLDSLSLNLIKDWDWTIIVPDQTCKAELIELATTLGFTQEGSTITVIRYRSQIPGHPVRATVGDKKEALWEASIKVGEGLLQNRTELELPMSSLYIETDQTNIGEIMALSRTLYENSGDLERINPLVGPLASQIRVPPHTAEGLFDIKGDPPQYAGLSQRLIGIIEANPDPNVRQFLASMLVEPDRVSVRLPGKNLPKAKNIQDFYKEKGLTAPAFLPTPSIKMYVGKFFAAVSKELRTHIDTIKEQCLENLCRSIDHQLDQIGEFFNGVNLPRISDIIRKTNSDYQARSQALFDETMGKYQGFSQLKLSFNRERDLVKRNLTSKEKELKGQDPPLLQRLAALSLVQALTV